LIKRGEVATFMIQEANKRSASATGWCQSSARDDHLRAGRPDGPSMAASFRSTRVKQAARQQVVAINRGRRDGLEIGHVLALCKPAKRARSHSTKNANSFKLPDERIGEMFVFRIFETLSYALVMSGQNRCSRRSLRATGRSRIASDHRVGAGAGERAGVDHEGFGPTAAVRN